MRTSGSQGQPREVGAHVKGRRLGHDAEALVLDSDLARHQSAAIGADEVLAADRVRLAAVVVPDDGADPIVVLGQLEQLVVEADPSRREPLGPGLQDRLEPDLGQIRLKPGAGRAPEFVVTAGSP